MSVVCPDCGTLALVKSPKAVTALRERMSGKVPEKKKPETKGWADDILKGI